MKRVLVLAVCLVCLVWLVAGGSSSTSVYEPKLMTSNEVGQDVLLLLDDNLVKVSFIEIFEEPSIIETCYLRLEIENKTDEKITVLPMDCYVNDTAILLMSGVSMTLDSGKKSQTPFIITYKQLGISSMDEIEKIELKFTIEDEEFNTLGETDRITIQP